MGPTEPGGVHSHSRPAGVPVNGAAVSPVCFRARAREKRMIAGGADEVTPVTRNFCALCANFSSLTSI